MLRKLMPKYVLNFIQRVVPFAFFPEVEVHDKDSWLALYIYFCIWIGHNEDIAGWDIS